MKMVTTPAFMPVIRKNASAKAAGQRHDEGARTLLARASSSHGSSA
jgi:hypothetical protein